MVASDARRAGIGRRLVLAGLEWADAMGAHPTGNPRDTILRAVTAAESGQKDPGLFLAGAVGPQAQEVHLLAGNVRIAAEPAE